MSRRSPTAFPVLAILLATSGAFAQQLPGAQQPGPARPAADPAMKVFEDYVNGPGYLGRVGNLLLMEEKRIAPECNAPKLQGRVNFLVLRPPAYQGGIHPASGAWRERVKVDRCGKEILHNLLAIAQPGAEPQLGLLFPGTTMATPPLQRDGFAAAGAEAVAKLNCKETVVDVLDTVADPAPLVPMGVNQAGLIVEGKWREVWTLRACKKTLPVAVVFTADGKGGATVEATTKIDKPKAPAPKK